MDNNVINEIKGLLVEIMLTGKTTQSFATRLKYSGLIGFNHNTSRWELTPAGKEWLDEQV